MKTTELTPVQRLIIHEIYKAVEKLDGGLELLGAIGSWGDTLEESEVLDLLKHWNKKNVRISGETFFRDADGKIKKL